MDADRRFTQVESCHQFSTSGTDQQFAQADDGRQYSPLNTEQQQYAQNNNGVPFSLNNEVQFTTSDNRSYSLNNNNQQFQTVHGARQFQSLNANQFSSNEENVEFPRIEKQYSQLTVSDHFDHLKVSDQFNTTEQFNPALTVPNQFTSINTDKHYTINTDRHFQSSESTKQFVQIESEGQFTNTEAENNFHSVETESHFQSESEAQFPNVDTEQFSTDIRSYCTTELVDEETNNGPLDFSLHRAQDLDVKMEIIPLEDNVITTPNKQKKPRVKLTLRETPEQRDKRLREGRERMRRLRANESLEEREVRLQKARECQERRRQRERLVESNEERERRLAVARERTRLRRAQETIDQREKRLKATRERLRLKRACESPEERQRRLQRMRERKHVKPSDDKEFMRRRRRRIKFEEDVERRQTRGISIKYDAFDDDLDDALFQVAYSGCAIPWVAEPEVCLSVDSSQNAPSVTLPPQAHDALSEEVENVPAAQALQDQISQHVSNLVLKTEDCPPTVKEPLSPKSHKQKLKNYYKNSVTCHFDKESETGTATKILSHTVQLIESSQKHLQIKDAVKKEGDILLRSGNFSHDHSHSAPNSLDDCPTQINLPTVMASNTEFEQTESETPLNLNQRSYLHQRYTPPPPYTPPMTSNSVCAPPSYGIIPHCSSIQDAKNINQEQSSDSADK